ncbi:nucleoside phosphatase family-domain-containing protein [Lactarius akahatsu]|uniref:Nucleoside phosphatase family-domain-containing protein n=1 Tax=Lactarius akahatsu TaxID=416441 RepID=A0AAD4QI32_9AGAM|nr:nucleoside phosphatase family-domain-containing protein [Lactarius akahatsu]
MPPPTAADAWFNSRRFGIVVDAGSSGSRLQIYSWRDARMVRDALGAEASRSLPRVGKGTQRDEDWVIKAEPGISSFAENLDDIPAYLAPLLKHARSHIPPSLHHETPLFLLATAGMRLLSPEQQAAVLQTTCDFLSFHSDFRIEGPSPAGPCGSSVRIITGEEEGLFGWIAVNYLMDGFGPSNSDRSTYGFLDMGGASTQIAFEPSPEEQEKAQNLVEVRLRLIGGEEISHKVFVTTWLGYGTNQARERYVGQAIRQHELSHPPSSDESPPITDVIEDPCLPKDLTLIESPVFLEPSVGPEQKSRTLHGTGSFDRCLAETSPLLNKSAPCRDAPCLFNGVHVPPIDFSVSHFIGISEYWYSSEHVFGLGGPYNFVQYERAAQEFCGKPWNEILRMHEASRKGLPGGNGDDKGAKASGLDKRGDRVEVSRLQMQCFKAAWVINVLHDGLGMPRIVDSGGNDTTQADEIKDHAEKKGLWRPWFQSMESVGDMAITWTLGKMVLEASKEVPPSAKDSTPLPDPLEAPSNSDDSRIIDTIDDHISSHLPPSLTRHSLGYPLAGVLSCLFMILLISLITCRLRRYIRICLRRLAPIYPKRDRDLAESSMEQGGPAYGDGPVASPYSTRASFVPSLRWWRHLRRMTPMWHRHRSPQHTNQMYRPIPRLAPASPARASPIRSSPSFTFAQQSELSTSTSTSPTLGNHDDYAPLKNADAGEASSVSLYSRSRNSSTISLSVLVPRQPLSRTASAHPLH